MELLRTIEVPLYIRQVKLSEKRRPLYFQLGKKQKIPKKYQDKTKYGFKPIKYTKEVRMELCDLSTGKRVIRNPIAINKPHLKTINGQDIYNQTIVQESRNKMLKAIKEFFVPFIEKVEPLHIEDLPIRIETELFYTYLADNGQPWDIDNHFYLYQKAFQDVMQGNKDKDGQHQCRALIPEDHNLIISKPPSPLHIPVASKEERKLVFFLYKEDDPRIINFPGREELFKKHVIDNLNE